MDLTWRKSIWESLGSVSVTRWNVNKKLKEELEYEYKGGLMVAMDDWPCEVKFVCVSPSHKASKLVAFASSRISTRAEMWTVDKWHH